MKRLVPLALLVLAIAGTVSADEPVQWKVPHPIFCLAVSPDGKMVAVGGPVRKIDWDDPTSTFQPGVVSLLDAATGKSLRKIELQRTAIAIAFSPDGKRLLTGELTRGGVIAVGKKGGVFPIVWDVETGKELLRLDGHTDMIKGVAFFPDGKRMVTASGDGTARIWDAKDGKELLVIKTGHFNESLTLAKDGKRLAVGSGNTIVTIWDAETGKANLALKHHYSGKNIALAADSSLIAVCSDGTNDITLWDGKTGKKTGAIVVGKQIASNVNSNLLFSPDGKWLVTGNGDLLGDTPGELTIWDVAGKKRHSAHKGQPGRIVALAFTPDGKRLLSASGEKEGTVLVWDFAKLVPGK